MCLAFPGKISEIKGKWAIVDFNGIKKRVNISLVKARKNDYVVVHAGFAIQKLNPKSALEVFQIYEQSKNR
jgi:hydrogenase expression/formation protein HypC